MEVKAVISAFLIGIGCFFIVISSIGLIRFPDFYTRIHPAGKSDSFGQSFVLLGLVIYEGISLESIKLLLIVLFIYVANPTATHALAKAAYMSGLSFWKPGSEGTSLPSENVPEEEGKPMEVQKGGEAHD